MAKTKVKEREQAPALFDDAGTSTTTKAKMPKKPAQKTGTAVANVEQLPVAQPGNLLVAIAQAAADPKCEPAKMHALLDARDRLMKQEAHVAFVTAYIEMREELPTIDAKGRIEIEAKRAGSKRQDTRYATYLEIQKVTKPILRKHKFSMMMLPDIGPNGAGVLMRGQLAYVCKTQYGQMVHIESCVIAAPLETGGSKNNVQGVGSSLSYTKRYAAVALLDLVSEAREDHDDDGNAGKRRKSAGDGDGGGVPIINDKQAAELTAKVGETVGAEIFCERYAVAKIADLPAHQFEEAMTACATYAERKKEQQQKRQAAGEQQ